MTQKLAQLLDPGDLDRAPGPRAKLSIVVPEVWARAGAKLRVTAPKRLVCARCDGGGCDGCARSGALIAPDDPALRTLEVRLPSGLAEGTIVRLPQPFGPEHPIAQLLLEVQLGQEPSPLVSRILRQPLGIGTLSLALWLAVGAALVLLVASRLG